MANTTHTCSHVTRADLLTKAHTAFLSFADLRAACLEGYVPTLSRAASELRFVLTSQGFRVFEI